MRKFNNLYLSLIYVLFFTYVESRTFSTNNDMKYIRACNETSTISLNTMNEVLINKKLSDNETSEFKCFLHCLFTKYGWMDEDGGFLLTEIRENLEETAIDSVLLEYILYRCTTIFSVDRCYRAFHFTECFWDKIRQAEMAREEDEDKSLIYDMDEVKKIKSLRHILFV